MPVVLDVLFQHATLQPHWGSWHIVFPSSMLVPCWFTVFVFWPGHSTTKSQAWHGCFCFVLRWWTSGKITSEILFIAKCCHQECAAHDCSRFAHARRGSFWVLTSFLLGPYEDLLTVLTVCSQFAHGFLTVCSCCSRFGGWCVYLNEETHKQTMPHFLFWAMCTKGTQLAGCRLLEADFQIWNQNTHMPLTTLRWSGVATPLPQPEICMCNVPFEPKGLKKYTYIMVLWHVPL